MNAPPSVLRFACPGCAAVLEAAGNAAGAVVLCPYCNASMSVPGPAPAATLPQAPLPAPAEPPARRHKSSARKSAGKHAPSQYYLKRNGEEYGPFTSKQLREMARIGQLAPTDLVWKKGFKDWKPAAKARGLFGPRP